MGNNQALHVGAESLGVFVAGLMAAIVVKLPLPVFGGVLILAALADAVSPSSSWYRFRIAKEGSMARMMTKTVAIERDFDTAYNFIMEPRNLPPWGCIRLRFRISTVGS